MTKRKELTQKQRDEIVAVLSAGCSRTAAARCVRCSPYLLQREILEKPDFAEQVAKAESGTELMCLSHIRSAAKKEQYWRAAAWLLERRMPELYGNKKANTFTAEQVKNFMTHCLQVLVEEIPVEEQRNRIIERMMETIEAL